MANLSIYDRIIYHLKNRKKSAFSQGYVDSAKKSKELRDWLIVQDKWVASKIKKPLPRSDVAYNKGFEAFSKDLDK